MVQDGQPDDECDEPTEFYERLELGFIMLQRGEEDKLDEDEE